MAGFFDRQNPLFFRKGGELDFGPAAWAATILVGLVSFMLAGTGHMSITAAAWAFMGSFVVVTAIAGAYAERAFWIAQSKAVGEVASALAGASNEPDPGGAEPLYREFDDPGE